LRLRTEKTGTVVCCPLPAYLIDKLQSVRSVSSQYFFWTGISKPKSAVGDYQRSLKRLFKLAGVSRGHAHRFRHTFAKRLLMKGVPLERVAVLMGHRSPSITLKHYASWVKERQEQLEADVIRIWDVDDDQKRDAKPLKRPESAIQTLYGNSSKWLN
jgi:integrase